MALFLVSIHRPDGYDPSCETLEMGQHIDQLNQEMVDQGVRKFAGGLKHPSEARAIRLNKAGKTEVTEGIYLRCGEHVGGFWLIEVPDISVAVAWGRKAAVACKAQVEVRPFH